ncbi:MAG: AtzE family amidohydrolase [Pseudomonadota bacterium]
MRAGRRRAVEIADAAIATAHAQNPAVNAFTDWTETRMRGEAAALDADPAVAGPLAGVPYAVKNLLAIAELTTRAGAKIERETPPATADSAVVRRASAAGGLLMGALNMGEYAYDFTGENAHDGACRNPHDLGRMSGGSSSGSGAAVAAGLVPIAYGSDTNGSIRVPAALCGVFGLKPTYGRISRLGCFPFCDSFDHLGPLARTPKDLALAYDAIQGREPDDPHQADGLVEPTAPLIDRGVGGLRIAIAGGYFATDGLADAGRAVAAAAAALGATRTVPIDGAAEARAAAYLITNIEGATLHLANLRARPGDFDPDTRDRFLAGALLPGAWGVRAQQVRRWFAGKMAALFSEIDLLIAPATPFTAPQIGQREMTLGGRTMLVRPNLGLFAQPFSCVGLPVAAAPVFPPGELPIGVQLVAAPWREDLCLRAAQALHRAGVAITHPPP